MSEGIKLFSQIQSSSFSVYVLKSHLRSSGPAFGSCGFFLVWQGSPFRSHHRLTSWHLQVPPLSSHSGQDLRHPANTQISGSVLQIM